MANYDSNYAIAQEISARIGVSPIPSDSVYSICLAIYKELGGTEENFDSVYSILLSILPLVEGGGANQKIVALYQTDEGITVTTKSTNKAQVTILVDDTSTGVRAVVWGDGTYTETNGTSITDGDTKHTIIVQDKNHLYLEHTYETSKVYSIKLVGTRFTNTLGDIDFDFVRSLYIDKGVEYIGDSFIYLQTVDSITFNDKCTTTLTSSAFYSAEIGTLYLPKGIKIDGYIFWNARVANFIFGGNVFVNNKVPDYFNYLGSILSKLELPEGVTTIGNYAFYVDSPYIGGSLKKLTLPSTVTTIGDEAFNYILDNDAVVDIPASVTSIGKNAFYRPLYKGSGSTQDGRTTYTVICRCTTLPTLGKQVFYATNYTPPTYCTLYVPNSVIDLYKNAEQWKEFGTILPIESMGLDIATTAEINALFA